MRYLILLGLLFFQFTNAQNQYPQDYFRSPLNIPIILNGTFGELRSNHFHSGIDIKTQLREGLDVFAVAEGYVSRIKIQHYGYGKALYITHPNGYTSVYAHLQKFSPEIEAFIKKEQYKKQSYEIEIYPSKEQLLVQKGDVIAISGNTGSSGGPHLHFELRDAQEKPINPLLFGYHVKDTKAPNILSVHAYPIEENSMINNSNKPTQLKLTPQANGSYLTDKIYASGAIGLGVETYDQLDMAANKNGAYKVNTKVNNSLIFEYYFETFSFDESKYINTLIDYPFFVDNRRRIQKCFIEPYNKLSIYNKRENNGIININNELNYQITLEVSDFANNTSTIIIPIEGKEQNASLNISTENEGEYLIANRDNIFNVGNASLFFPEDTFYYNFFINLKEENDAIIIHNKRIPIKNNYTLSIPLKEVDTEEDINKFFIAHVSEKGDYSYQHTYRKENILSTRTHRLGKFVIAKDSVAPNITPVNFKDGQSITNQNFIKVKITDDLSGINTYRATLNGEWILMEYEYKKNTLTYNLNDHNFKTSENKLEIVVTDNVGNSNTFKATYFKK